MTKPTVKSQLTQRVAALRIAFGLVWAVDAAFKWQPAFINSFMDNINAAAEGQPTWLTPWFTWWQHLFAVNPSFFAYSVAVVETLIALALIFGFAKRVTYLLAIIFSLAIWSVAEGFGGPYTSASTDVGAGIIYAIVFFALYGLEQLAGESRFSVDNAIERKLPWWHLVADPGR
jgi:nitrite reductase (NO-forming)